jgi:hypothetical protein
MKIRLTFLKMKSRINVIKNLPHFSQICCKTHLHATKDALFLPPSNSWSRVLFEKLTILHLLKISNSQWTVNFITPFTTARHWSLSLSTCPYFTKNLFSHFLLSLSRFSKLSLTFNFFPRTRIICPMHFPRVREYFTQCYTETGSRLLEAQSLLAPYIQKLSQIILKTPFIAHDKTFRLDDKNQLINTLQGHNYCSFWDLKKNINSLHYVRRT